jgi:hypothetical protein
MKKGWTVPALFMCISLSWALSLQAVEKGDSTKTKADTAKTKMESSPVAQHSYIGASKCKMCHLKQYKAWSAGKMATAFADLKGDEAKDPKCVKCHVTGFGKGGYAIGGANDPDLMNVQCEACHGPGSDYKSVMKDKEKAVAAGLIVPDEKVCVGCHNKESPNFKGFDFAAMKEKVHPVVKE